MIVNADDLGLLPSVNDGIFEAILSNDGKRIIYRLNGIPGDLSYMHRDSSGRPQALLDSRFDERSPAISPDDQWLSYVSDETGRDEVYVRPFPEGGGRWLISAAGGNWSRHSNGRQASMIMRELNPLRSRGMIGSSGPLQQRRRISAESSGSARLHIAHSTSLMS